MQKKRSKKNSRPENQSAPWCEKHHRALLLSILVLALAVRIAGLLALKESIYFKFLLWDERVYHTWAEKIIAGTAGSTVYEFAPLPAYLMALVYRIAGSTDIILIRGMNILVGTLTCFIIYRIGRELTGNRTIGLVSCLVAALYKPFIFYSAVPLKTALAVFLFSLMALLFIRLLRTWSRPSCAWLGLVFGLLVTVQSQAVILLPVLPLLLAWQGPGKNREKIMPMIALYGCGFLLAVTPFVARNYLVAGKIALTRAQTGFNLYNANNLDGRPAPFATTSPFEEGTQYTIEASRRVGRKLEPGEASSYWTWEVIRAAADDPAGFMKKISVKTLVLLNAFERGNNYHIGFMGRHVPFFSLPFFSLWFILPLGIAGIVSGCRSGPAASTARGLAAILLAYGSTMIIFLCSTEYRLPLLTVLIPFAVFFLHSLHGMVRTDKRKQAMNLFGVAVFFAVVEFLPVPPTGDLTAFYNTHAIALKDAGRLDEAMEYWKTSSTMQGIFSDFANLSLAGKYLSRKDIDQAQASLAKISDDSIAAAYKYDLQGDILLYGKNIDAAVGSYEKSLSINSGQRVPQIKLARIFERIDPARGEKEKKKLEYISSFYN